MTHGMTLNDLLAALRSKDDGPVRFKTPRHVVKAGYHLTEFKLASFRSIDCGRGAHGWTEAVVELLDGNGHESDEYMHSSKLVAIMAEAVTKLSEAGDAPLILEFGSEGLARYRIETVVPIREGAGGWAVSLVPLYGQCKASARPSCCKPQSPPALKSCCNAA